MQLGLVIGKIMPFVCTWIFGMWLGSVVTTTHTSNAMGEYIDKSNANMEGMVEQHARLMDAYSDIRDQYESSKAELVAARALINSGTVGVYVEGYCPSMPADTEATSGNDAAPVRLGADAGRALYDFRLQYLQQRKQLLECQAYVRSL